jgi:hypothetical protein
MINFFSNLRILISPLLFGIKVFSCGLSAELGLGTRPVLNGKNSYTGPKSVTINTLLFSIFT